MSVKPVRLQRLRKKGAKLVSPNGLPVVCVTRPAEWGNPFKIGLFYCWGGQGGFSGMVYVETTEKYADERFTKITSAAQAVEWYRKYLGLSSSGKRVGELRGKNLACFCKIGEPCHADVLLEFANPGWPVSAAERGAK